MRKLFSLLLLSSICSQAIAQSETIISVGNKKVDKAEFQRVYERNNTAQSSDLYTKSNLDSFTDLYSLFLMKLQEAHVQGLDTTQSYKTEVDNYKRQLADKYQKENKYMDQLVKEAYEREKKEYNISHIMLAFNPSADIDTSVQINDLALIQKDISEGKITFEDAAKKFSLDKSSANRGGSVGWVTSMQTPYSLENVFINLKKGEISDPVISPYGVHLIRLNDVRDNFGELHISQILIEALNASGDDLKKAEDKANMVYQELESGKISWEDAVKKYSQDVYTNEKGGDMDWFGPGSMIDTFENTALYLAEGKISKPFKTNFGYHIIKKLGQRPLKSFSESERAIRNKIEYTERGQKAKQYNYEAMVKALKAERNDQEFINIMSTIDSTQFYSKSIPKKVGKKEVFRIMGHPYNFNDVYEFMLTKTRGRMGADRNKIMAAMYDQYFNNELQKYHMDYLSETNPNYANLLEDYSNGILIFDLMETNIWKKAVEDTAGQLAYFNMHRDEYNWGPSVEYDLYKSSSKEDMMKLQQVLGKETSVPDEAVVLIKDENPESDMIHIHRKENIDQVDQAVLAKLKNYQDSGIIEEKGQFLLYVPNQYLDKPSPRTFEESKSYVISDYQREIEENLNQSLKAKYPVELNQKVYNSLIK